MSSSMCGTFIFLQDKIVAIINVCALLLLFLCYILDSQFSTCTNGTYRRVIQMCCMQLRCIKPSVFSVTSFRLFCLW